MIKNIFYRRRILRNMPYSSEHKRKTRERILDSALYLFTRHGYESITIDQLMEHAGLTRGAFYAHFANKSEVYAEAILSALRRRPDLMPVDGLDEQDWLRQLFFNYLSHDHVSQKSGACPLAFLATDVANRDPAARDAYTEVYKQLSRLIGDKLMQHADHRTAFAITAMMIGGVALCRALSETETVEQVLNSCRQTALRLLEAPP